MGQIKGILKTMETVIISANQMLIMTVFMAIGFAFKKFKLFDDGASAVISKLVVNVFLPSMTFLTFAKNFTYQAITEKSSLLLMAVIILGVTYVLSVGLAHLFSKKKETQDIYIYSFTIPNLGYMGYPLVKAIFGEAALLETMIFTIPFNIFIYTAGMMLLTPQKKVTLKFLLNPSIVAIVLGMIVGVAGIKLPAFATGALEKAEACMGPAAMILTGVVFARMNLKSIFGDPKAYIASAIRLLAIPIAVLFVLRALNVPHGWILSAVAMLAMPMGLNSVVFPEAYGGDSETGAKCSLMSGFLAIATIPIVFGMI